MRLTGSWPPWSNCIARRSPIRSWSVSLFHCIFLHNVRANSSLLGDDAHAEERRRYTEEVETLKVKAATAEGLAAENITLRAELHSTKTQRTTRLAVDLDESAEQLEEQGAAAPCRRVEDSTVSIEEYNNLKQELVDSTRDYEKLLLAHKILESKFRKYKDRVGQWRAGTSEWVLRHPEREPKPPSQDDPRPAQRTNAHGQRAVNALAPPAFSEGTTPTSSSLSRSTSPQRPGYKPPKDTPDRLDNLVVPQSGDSKRPTDEIRGTQTKRDHDPHVASDAPTQASDESEDGSGTLDKLRSQNSGRYEEALPTPSATHNGSSPIIISERSLKRKRGTRNTGEGPKSPRVKDEITSSSPLSIDFLRRLGEPNDSIDLDDVGDQLTTPRKRQRMELQQLRTTIMAPSVAVEKEEGLLKTPKRPQHIGTRLVDVEDAYAYQASREIVSYAQEIAMDDQVIRNREDNQGAFCKDEKRALFKAHNDRVVGRRDSAEQSPSGSTSEGGNYRSLIQSACTPGSPPLHGLPTPATNGYAKTLMPQDHRDSEQQKAEIAAPTILRPTDTNTNILPRTSDGLATYKQLCPPSRRDRGAAAVPALAEDGEDHGVSGKRRRPDQESRKESRASDIHHRLGALLSEHHTTKGAPPLPSPQARDTPRAAALPRTPLSRMEQQHRAPHTPATLPSKKRVPLGTLTSMNPPMTEGSRPSSAPTKMPSARPIFQKPSRLDNPPDIRGVQEPLRSRPLHLLRLEDFKLNPAHSDFVYHDSIRKHDEKRALSGCTAPHCPRCKDLRKFIENSNYANLPPPNSDDGLNDNNLILGYLGGDMSRIENLTEMERKDILAEAKVKQFADRFGKHRTLFGRAKSPVGFWDVGFPDTQEEKRNREEARGRGREMVEERYWEAVRKGGRWVFADDR